MRLLALNSDSFSDLCDPAGNTCDPAGIRTLFGNQRLNSIWNGFAFLLTELLTIFMCVLAAIAIV